MTLASTSLRLGASLSGAAAGRVSVSCVRSAVTHGSGAKLAGASLEPLSPGGVWQQSARWMGRGPTIQGRKNATDAVCSAALR
jgi:hypothetical protein